MARGMPIEAEHFDNLRSRAARRSRAKREDALALMNQRRQIDAELFRLLPQLVPHDFDAVAAVLHTDRVDLAGWASLDDLRPSVEALLADRRATRARNRASRNETTHHSYGAGLRRT